MTAGLIWFRQDLRLSENRAFIEACSHHQSVIPLYIYDPEHSVLGSAQAWWLHHSLIALNKSLKQRGLELILRRGHPLKVILDIVKEQSIEAVYWSRCYEPEAIARDKKIKATLLENGIKAQSLNSSVFHEPWTIQNKNGDYYKVFTPYWKHCKQTLHTPSISNLNYQPTALKMETDHLGDWQLLPKLSWADRFSDFWTPGEKGAQQALQEFINQRLHGYKTNRDFPQKNATSRLSPHLHFGEISPWAILRALELAAIAPTCDLISSEHFLSELGWREFSIYLLYHFPKLPYENFQKEFNAFPWQNDEQLLSRWQKGLTGYPIIDAGMRELWKTGYMHNRVRMIVASFLTKDLLIDWRKGADWFLDTLLDADLANNSASWQWVAGCGADAAPYFRIFNPVLQSQKFDPEGTYIRQWVNELSPLNHQSIHAPWQHIDANEIYSRTKYPPPMINHSEARVRALAYYQQLKKKSGKPQCD